MSKLSKAQIFVLEQMAAGNRLHSIRGPGGHDFFASRTRPISIATTEALLRRGLVQSVREGPNVIGHELTVAGRAALATPASGEG